MRKLLRFFLRLLYGFRCEGEACLNEPGPLILAPNHVSWLDWLFLGVVLGRDWKFVTSRTTANTSWILRRVMINDRTFPVDPASAYAVREMADFLQQGGKLVLFPEGRISRTGGMMKVYDGIAFLLHRSGARVITAYLRGANRLPWVVHPGWTQLFPRVSVHFDAPKKAPDFPGLAATVWRQRATAWLRDQMIEQQFRVDSAEGAASVPAAFGELAARVPSRLGLEDAAGVRLTCRELCTAAEVLAGAWKRRLGGMGGEHVGVLLPNVAATPVTLFSLWSAAKVPAILNFSSGVATMRACAQLAGVRDLVTSRRFLEMTKLDLSPLVADGVRVHLLEDVRGSLSLAGKLGPWLRNRLRPGALQRQARVQPSDTAVILFTSGSEGVPKGVELTHANLLANVRQIAAAMDITDQERFFSALPLFHSLGLVGGLLFPLLRGCYTFLYPSPLHYRIVPTLVYEHDCTVMLATNTFLNGYARKANAYDFCTLRFLVAGAEKVQSTTFDTWARRFGVRVLEGYGATECSPVVSVNSRVAPKLGTAGKLLPGMEWRLEAVEGVADGGRLWVRGPNVMKGYLNPDAQVKFARGGGWYDTGDIAQVDDEGYVTLRGRLKRFAKISGEMVSLTAVEDALAGAFPVFGQRLQIAIIAVPDADKGEKLVAVTNDSRVALAEIRAVLREKGYSNLSAPREVRVVNAIPKLGTGKVDHRKLQEQLKEQAAVPA
ncbi:AMP-dependent synthetase [Opitutaceae bacterium EW11]|nr:AMP-dependent synthetase [Opitutaceae bacterium EW11]